MVSARKEEALDGTLDISLEQVWVDFEDAIGDRMPEPIHPDDRSWFTLDEFIERYKISRLNSKKFLDQQIEDGLLEAQIQRRGNHNVKCYRPIQRGGE